VRARDPDRYADRLAALAGAHAEQAAERRCEALRARLHQAHPRLAALLTETCDDPVWDARLARLPAAWAWARARAFFDSERAPGREARLEAELAAAEQSLAAATATLATEQAWQHCLERMNAAQVAALQSYRAAIDARGKGFGRHAAQFSRAARDAMRDAQAAVPAWIMPVPDVLSTIPPVRDSFDVVIVDEASQASLESLFLLWLAPRVIVVGDDRQCTPPEVALGALDPIFARLHELLPDLPSYLRVSFTPRSSLFSILRSRFGQVIRLREHFRCMPEIIEWSSSMFYRDAPLVPLRQFGSDRLEPLRTVYVPGAFNEGKNATLRNQVEAEALVMQLLRCAADPAYEGRTFGVIVLQGNAQADLIRNALLRRMSRQEQEDRRLRIGTPPDFQGDERHVVFLSMVLAPDTRTMALTKLEYQRRFNVAASRARDQVWLFHSVTPDALNPSDLRHSYLTYLRTRPHTGAPDGFATVVRRDVPVRPFESLFEQRVFLDIRARGFSVTPQVEVNGRRIDLVVTGGAAKLAVECDGDAWHSSPEQIEADLARERELKRAGWRFWRVRGSEYNFDPEAALTGLWQTLDGLGISPSMPVWTGGGPGSTHVRPSSGVAVPSGAVEWEPMALVPDEGLDDLLEAAQ
uniref:AAA domain-containing protein n=1 Tax=Frankia sp. Cppng1_Ct_nod TaxID=2897162 RepID=UPI0020259FDB